MLSGSYILFSKKLRTRHWELYSFESVDNVTEQQSHIGIHTKTGGNLGGP